ncbi:MAG: carboxylesterase/lipase family protein [Selenomonas sp.]|nr:carboxylesterase/lipase family protein [Selenomonas sp.]
MNKKKLAMFAVTALLCGSTFVSQPQLTEAAENPMQIIWDQSAYNPHLNDPVVKTQDAIVSVKAGKLQGSKHDGVYQYLGIPYAEATKRFVRAEAVKPWQGVKDATQYGKHAPQLIFGSDTADIGEDTSNNDQNLNIWTTSLDKKAKKPVMVWLHGGGFASGTANEAQYDGENLSRLGDVVVVSVNHRLNALGFLNLADYGEVYKDSANISMVDIVDSLKWIKENIAAFGGDSDNVTLFGESGGGAKILTLMAAPSAKGLFQKGIVESGATDTMGVSFTPDAVSREVTRETLKILNIDKNNIEELQTLPIETLWQATSQAQANVAKRDHLSLGVMAPEGIAWEPVTGTDFLPTNPVLENGFAESGRDVTLMIGSNLNEWNSLFPMMQPQNLSADTQKLYNEAYPNEKPNEAAAADTFLRLPLLKIMSHKADQGGAPVYAYVFTKQNVDNNGAGVYHTAEIPYVFSNTKNPDKLATTMSLAWANFARYGQPSAPELPQWERYTRQTQATMILDDVSVLRHNHDKKLIQALAPNYKY